MKIILYTNRINGLGKKLEKEIHHMLTQIELETLNSVKSLTQKLCQPLNRISVIVFIVSIRNELKDFMKLLTALENIRIILLLPDRSEKTVAMAVKLNPSFISYTDNRLIDIIEVLKKIQQVTKEKNYSETFKNNESGNQYKVALKSL